VFRYIYKAGLNKGVHVEEACRQGSFRRQLNINDKWEIRIRSFSHHWMNSKTCLCALHDEYECIIPFTVKKKLYEFSGSPDVLSSQETKWRDIYHFLFERGLELRPRYSPGWTPSWLGTEKEELDCEDGIMATVGCLSESIIPLDEEKEELMELSTHYSSMQRTSPRTAQFASKWSKRKRRS